MVQDRLSSTLTTKVSIGSHFSPSTSRKITCGAQTCNSHHSRRIVSISTERCNSPLQETRNFQSEESTSSQTFVSNSFSSLSLKFLVVIYFHSCHANGESFTRNSICNVGLSMAIDGKGSTFHVHTVSQTKISGIPAMVIISQHFASSCSIL
jgi:hypothetical protein